MQKIPKIDRFTIGQQCLIFALKIMGSLFMANAKRNKKERLQILQDIDLKKKILTIHIRLLYDARAIDQQKYIRLIAHLQEIGKMLGGWIKTTTQESLADINED